MTLRETTISRRPIDAPAPKRPSTGPTRTQRVAQWRCSWHRKLESGWMKLALTEDAESGDEARLKSSKRLREALRGVCILDDPDQIIVRYISHVTRQVKA